jgi:hypothetical protein
VDDDVIGREPERAPRRRRSVRGVPLPAGLRRHRRLAATLVVLVVAAGVVAVSRAGISNLTTGPGAQAGASPAKPPVAGEVLGLAAGQHTVYAVVDDCSQGCRPTLVASDDDGRRWAALTLPGARVGAPVARSWRLAVTGVEDLLAVEDDARGTVAVGNSDTPFVSRRIVDGPPLPRVPAGRESMARICGKPRCAKPTVEYLEPRTGRRGPLLTQPPFPPRVLGVAGSQLWVAGIDPATRHYAAAVTADDGARWSAVPLPQVSTDTALVPRIVPIPELDQAYLLLGYPSGDGVYTSYDIWIVPAPSTTATPHRVRPEQAIQSVEGAVGLKDGRLALTGGPTTVLSPDGVEDTVAVSGVDASRYVLRQPMRGPHLLVVAEAVRTDGVASIATSDTGDANDWDVRPIVL